MNDAVERVRGICLALPEASQKSFGDHIIEDSYRLIATKRLVAQLDQR